MLEHRLTGQSLLSFTMEGVGTGLIFEPIVQNGIPAPPTTQEAERLRAQMPDGKRIALDAPVTLHLGVVGRDRSFEPANGRFFIYEGQFKPELHAKHRNDDQLVAVVDIALEVVESYDTWILNIYVI
ncbi:hypothetical protein HYW18_03530 [Candidatus Uhrbacteria bacterium]|nr:hypothetical protein [Candidatus Uhrbacteria bacterium]